MLSEKDRKAIVKTCSSLLGVKYKFGAEWNDLSIMPAYIDCSELVEGVFRKNGFVMPDGSQAQYDATEPIMDYRIIAPADLAFFGEDKNPKKIYHVGIVMDEQYIIEARKFDENASFKTGEVILRPRARWEAWKNFCGYRRFRNV